jgi:hypothetical protein
LQCVAVCCSVLQCVAVCCTKQAEILKSQLATRFTVWNDRRTDFWAKSLALEQREEGWGEGRGGMRGGGGSCGACSTLVCGKVCVCIYIYVYRLFSEQHTATHCNTLQHAATHYNTNFDFGVWEVNTERAQNIRKREILENEPCTLWKEPWVTWRLPCIGLLESHTPFVSHAPFVSHTQFVSHTIVCPIVRDSKITLHWRLWCMGRWIQKEPYLQGHCPIVCDSKVTVCDSKVTVCDSKVTYSIDDFALFEYVRMCGHCPIVSDSKVTVCDSKVTFIGKVFFICL